MTAKRWFIMLICTVALVAAAISALNIAVDPFSVFGDRLFNWHSYGMTNNPRTAKFAYIDSKIGEYDAFIIGPSGASGISPETLEEYTGLRWYNMFNYGADLAYTKNLAAYLVETHRPKQILLTLPVISASLYEASQPELTHAWPLEPFWRTQFLFANPKYSRSKIEHSFEAGYFQQIFDVFIAETGVYNKSKRDAEAIEYMGDYLAAYPDFAAPLWNVRLTKLDECVAAVAEIADICKRYGSELIIATSPLPSSWIEHYDLDEIHTFLEKISAISGFWDFTFSSISDDPRYFYDITHFRNSVGEMMMARIFDDDSIFVPDDFGIWVTSENVSGEIKKFYLKDLLNRIYDFTAREKFSEPKPHSQELPIILYHHLAEEVANPETTITPARFEEHMRALYDAGYSTVSLEEVRAYVLKGRELPDNPVLITFDDGYMSNYTYAFPILRRYNFKAAMFVVGVTFGADTYKELGVPIIPHFGEEEAKEMAQSGLITIQSHTFDMHQAEPYDNPLRKGVLRMEHESEEDYIVAFKNDFALQKNLLREMAGEELFAVAYPYGLFDIYSAVLLNELGVEMTFSTKMGRSTLIKGLPQSLLEMRRMNIEGEVTAEELLDKIR